MFASFYVYSARLIVLESGPDGKLSRTSFEIIVPPEILSNLLATKLTIISNVSISIF